MSTRLDILKNSLEKKVQAFDKKFTDHKSEVISNQCEPLAGNRRGNATLNRWDKTNNVLRTLSQGIDKTKVAIEREEDKIADCAEVKKDLPQPILDLLADGTLNQWRKYPHIFFVKDVEKARIYWDVKTKTIACKYASSVTDPDQYRKFAKVYNALVIALR